MTVTIRTYKNIRTAVGQKSVEWDVDQDATVASVLSQLADEHGIDPDDAVVMKNGTHVGPSERDSTAVEAGDSLSIT